MIKKLLGQKAVVTGANRSIGKEIALIFAEAGADVVISYRSDKAGATRTVEAIQKLGREAHAIHADFMNPSGVEDFFKQALLALRQIDILVNNAAGYDTTAFLELGVSTFESLLRVNVTAPMHLTQLVAKQMIEKHISGRVVNISSISGECPHSNRVAHASAKAALNMLTKNTALELAPHHIRVNALAPGGTPYEDSDLEGYGSPLGRAGTPRDQAEAALYLASDASAWMTGQIMTIDGGQSLL